MAVFFLSLCFNEAYTYGCQSGTVKTPAFTELLPYFLGSKGHIVLILIVLPSTTSFTISLLNPNRGLTPYLVGKSPPKRLILNPIRPQPSPLALPHTSPSIPVPRWQQFAYPVHSNRHPSVTVPGTTVHTPARLCQNDFKSCSPGRYPWNPTCDTHL